MVPPLAPPPEPPEPSAATVKQADASVGPGRRIVVGEMCPLSAAGRPGLAPLLLRGVQWVDDPTEVGNAIAGAESTPFAVFGVDGKRAGIFEVMSNPDVGIPQAAAAGTYQGSGPCTREKSGDKAVRIEEPQCQAATRGCGIAVAALGAKGAPLAAKTGGACVSGDELAIDIDGDGAAESFPISGLLDGVRAPADGLEARRQVAAGCTPTFTVFGIRIAPSPEPGKAADPRYLVLVDVLAVVDLDDDGLREVVIGLRYPDSRSVAIYSSVGAATTLSLIGEASSW
jgi:hypothetical protein